ncbi:T9SS type A sorting domain-containing protein, partial [Seonamhaeicola aphaedonensis]|uniref:T9SS type A sorting domain-containing protein n=1 Tax=Seonamhaeicola aphaedonensis TaxID=1461338 RepID=UPI0011C05604
YEVPVADAGEPERKCDVSTFDIMGNTQAGFTGQWSKVSGTGSITDVNSASTTVTGVTAGNSITVRWTLTNNANNTCYHSDDVTLYNDEVPVADAGEPERKCDVSTFDIMGNTQAGFTGQWSKVSGTGSITDVNSASTTVTGVTAGNSITVRWTLTNNANNTCYHSDDVTLTNNPNPSCWITGDNEICQGQEVPETATFMANTDIVDPLDIDYLWTGPGVTGMTTKSVSGLTIPGDYKVKITNNKTGCYTECTRTLKLIGIPVSPNVTPTNYCENDPERPTTLCDYANLDEIPNLPDGSTIKWVAATRDGNPYDMGALIECEEEGVFAPAAPTAVGEYKYIVEIDTKDGCITSLGAVTGFNVYEAPDVDAGAPFGRLCAEAGSVFLPTKFIDDTARTNGISHEDGSWMGISIDGDGKEYDNGLVEKGEDGKYYFNIGEGPLPEGTYTVRYTAADPETGCINYDDTTILVEECQDCGTAFGVRVDDQIGGVDTAISTCFREEGFRRWGWTNRIAENSGTTVLDLWRGAGRCILEKGQYIGEVRITYEGGFVSVVYDMADGVGLDEAHLYIGCESYPKSPSGSYTVAPGQYTFNSYDLTFNLGTYTLEPMPYEGDIYVIAHAVACTDGSWDFDYGYVPTSSDGEFVVGGEPIPNACKVDVGGELGKTASIKAYPVPFTNEVNIAYKYEYDTDVQINVYDIKGALIKQTEDTNYAKGTIGTQTINLSEADDQLYFVRLTTSKESAVTKIISAKSQ